MKFGNKTAKNTMNGLVAEIKGKNLVITVPMEDPPAPSGSGKNLIVATTHGNQTVECKVQGKNLTIGLNAYIKNGK